MLDSSRAQYAFIRACIFLLQSIVPLSIAHSIYEVLFSTPWHLHLLIRVWLAAEATFYLAFQLPFLVYLQRDAFHPPLRSKEDRRVLFARSTAHATFADLERHIRGWFKGAPWAEIGREGVKSWLAWAFFEGRIDVDGNDAQELEEYAVALERLLGKTFPPGNGKATSLRLTLDPVECVGIVDFLAYVRLCHHGYHFHRQALGSFFTLFPFRPVALTATQRSPAMHLTYWHRPHTSRTRLPVVFIHGIGIGLYPYVNFLRDLNEHAGEGQDEDGQIGILAIEVMPISSRITHAALGSNTLCRELASILDHHGFARCVLVSHSYGSVLTTHILHDPTLQHKVSSVLLIDPVSFLLHTPDVAYNFTVRKPTSANEYLLWYFGSQDPGVAHTLGRRFFWSENVLWLEDLMPLVQRGIRVSVSLASRDLIVDTEAVAKYLAQGAVDSAADQAESHKPGEADVDSGVVDGKAWKHGPWESEGLQVLWFDDTDHGQVFEKKGKRARLGNVVRAYCEGV